ncbi:MAG: NAD(P)-dependent oxidoreductase [Erysipelotrichaceae bacterium]|nr:NAD(P)-dependent oxidoreductase [Erysipelotrichaceae bacterium]MDD3924194.1 NAD(P)-dependent oxidoreductase [Erysipelotrichaceae bacterium]MDD4642094.1 NAD(P)-dependent oxidoreductase [Erysipelotrichaceae bacterium]
MSVGFIGTGVMGKSLIRHLLKADHEVFIYTRTKAKAQSLIAEGAIWEDSIKSIAQKCDVIMTMVGYPSDVEEVYLSDEGLIVNCKPGTLLIDMTTSTPSLAKKIANIAKTRDLRAIDAPVSGGDKGARDGVLTIMCGGEVTDFYLALPYLKLFGNDVVLQGDPGSGQHTKMCNQIAIASTIMGVCEALHYAQAANLDQDKVLASITKGSAGSWQLSNNGRKIIDEDFDPGFYIKHFIKDMKIAIDEARLMHIDLPGLKLAESLYEKVSESGNDNLGTQALIYWYQQVND